MQDEKNGVGVSIRYLSTWTNTVYALCNEQSRTLERILNLQTTTDSNRPLDSALRGRLSHAVAVGEAVDVQYRPPVHLQ